MPGNVKGSYKLYIRDQGYCGSIIVIATSFENAEKIMKSSGRWKNDYKYFTKEEEIKEDFLWFSYVR